VLKNAKLKVISEAEQVIIFGKQITKIIIFFLFGKSCTNEWCTI